MRPSPLQVRRLDLLALNVQVNEAWDVEAPSGWDTDLNGLQIAEKIELGDLVWRDQIPKLTGSLRLTIEVSGTNGKQLPHHVSASAAALIDVADAPTEQDLMDLLMINGCAVIYSSLREQILLATSRTPFGPMNLPTVNFMDLKGNVLAKDHLPADRGPQAEAESPMQAPATPSD